jgi:MEKHLA domain
VTIDAGWLLRHIQLLSTSYQKWTGNALIEPGLGKDDAVQILDNVPFAVVSHDIQPDPIFNYGNKLALQLFEMDWEALTKSPSRLSAEPLIQAEREQLLESVSKHGFIEDYNGIRISSSGKRFMIKNATVWNIMDEDGKPYGQAALIKKWHYLEGG